MTESEFRSRPTVDTTSDYRRRLEMGEDTIAALLGRAAAAPAAREERARCLLVAERILTKASALVGALASPDAAFRAERDAIFRGAETREQGEEP